MGKKVFIIAEAGSSHGGNLERGFRLIDAAYRAGADCVKFQIIFADEIIHPKSGIIKLPGGDVPLYERFKELEQKPAFYRELKKECERKGMCFLATPFGLKSAELLISMKPRYIKVASPELNHFPLLRKIASSGIPAILSSGVSQLSDIEKALKITGKKSILLHCITAYPAPETEYNIRALKTLSAVFGIETGISDHSEDPVIVPSLAASAGAVALEKHIALSNEEGGLDDSFALSPDNFKKMAAYVRSYENKNIDQAISDLSEIYGREKIEAVLGSGIKTLAPSEAENYRTTNRSVISIKNISKGEIFSSENIALLRSEKNIKPGLPPDFLNMISGRKALRDIPDGTGITEKDF